MSNELIIDGKPVEIVEYKGVRVITTKVMADHHGLETRVMNQKFRRNKKHFIENADYYIVTKDSVTNCDPENPESQTVIQSLFTQNNMDEVYLFTESGYLRFVKTINDDRAWHIYNQLMDAYFEKKNMLSASEKFLAKSTEHRNGLTHEWKERGATDYRALTLTEYQGLYGNTEIRKPNMNSDELTLLSVFEYIESAKLKNNTSITGQGKLRDSIKDTSTGIVNLITPKPLPIK